LTIPLDSRGIPDDGKNTFERSRGAAFFGKLAAPGEIHLSKCAGEVATGVGSTGYGLYLEPVQ
jgi:hypothetical protein